MKNKRLIRTIAIVLVALLVGGVVFGALMSTFAEGQTAVENTKRDRHRIAMEYLEGEQALHITQRLNYYNRCDIPLKAVVFYAAGNMFRRMDALMYDDGSLEKMFPYGYVPAGIDLREVLCDGKPTDYGFQGADEIYLRADCDVAPGQCCEFQFEYYLLLQRCGAFQGVGDTDVRLEAFCFVPAVYDRNHGEFALKRPLPFTRWLYCDAADYRVTLSLPRGFDLAATGEAEAAQGDDGSVHWTLTAPNARDFALSFGRRWRCLEGESDNGVRVRVLSNARGGDRRALDVALSAVNQCEAWFGDFPVRELEIAQSDYPLGALCFPGVIWISNDLLERGKASDLAARLRFGVAQQYFGLAAWTEPVADAWLGDAVSEYVACLLLEAAEGQAKFLEYVNRDWVAALQQTVPGGLHITSDAALFDADSYALVVLRRGAVVLHELRLAMGLEPLLDGLAEYVALGRDGRTLTEMDFAHALETASGRPWEEFLTDWLFNVGDYVNQTMVWYE